MKKLFLIILPALIISGCSIWENFTTFFNTYYNAKELFEKAEEQIQEQKKGLFETTETNIQGSAMQNLNLVIEKCSKILQFHPESGFVDDALLMLGKSFYYQKNYQKGLRKFTELVATQPESDLLLETELWIGKCQMRLKNYKDGLATLKSVRAKAIEEDNIDFINETYVEQIKYLIEEENYVEAISVINQFLDFSEDDEINAEVVFELGDLYKEVDELESAIVAYSRVSEFSPTFEIEYNAKIELGRALRKTGKLQEALDIFEDMRNEDKYAENFAEVELEIGVTQYDLGNVEEAVDQLIYVDTSYTNNVNSGIAKYKLGEIFQNEYQDFDSAAYYYSKAAGGPAPPEYILDAGEKNRLFKKYNQLRTELKENKQQLVYAQNPEEFVKDSIAFYSDTTGTNLNENNELENQRDVTRGRNNRNRNLNLQGQNPQQTVTRKPPIRPTISVDSVKSKIVKNKFELGNVFFTEFNLPDSARIYYKDVLENYSGSEFQARTMYALGSYYLTIDKQNKADSLFNEVYENYKNEQIVNAAADKLDKPFIDLNADPAQDLYKEAEQKMLNENYSVSLNEFYSIFKKYPESTFAPKALFAGGWILENKLELFDSAAVLYDSITTKYPQTEYASKIRQKLTYYKQERERQLRAIQDSLKKMQAIQDSIASVDSLNQLLLISTDSTKAGIDSLQTNKKIRTDSLKTNNEIISDSINISHERDSIEMEHQILMDSLRRDEQRNIKDSLGKELNLDSLKVRKPIKPPGGN